MSKNIILLSSLILLFYIKSNAQFFYYSGNANNLGIIDLSNGTCRDSNLYYYDGRFGDIAFSPDGRIFGTRGKELYDISNGGLILIGEFSGNVNSLTCNSDGIIYGASDDGGLHTYDLTTKIFRRIGTIPYLPTGDLTFNDGELYMASENNRMILVNINNPSASQVFMTINTVDPLESFYSVVTFAVDCDSVVTFALGGFFTPGMGQGTRIYALNLENKTTTLLCSVPVRMFGAATPLEFLASDCELVVDLDLDNSSGALVHDFFADSTCTTPAALTDRDVQVYAQVGKIDSLRIRLYEGVLAPGQEHLTLASPPAGIRVSGSGTTELLLVNEGSASREAFEAAIQALRYENAAPLAGMRRVRFVAYAGGDSSKVAVAHLPFGFGGGASAGQDTTLAVCRGAVPINLFTALGSNAASGGTWQPGSGTFNPASNSTGVYWYIVAGTCGADTAAVTIQLLPNVVQNIADTICSGTTYFFNNQNLTQSGIYRDTLQTAGSCDSIIVLTLQVSESIVHTLNDTICSSASYFFNNQNLTQSGTYRDTLPTANGCDSIVVLNLTVHSFINTNLRDTICDLETIVFGNRVLSQTGIYQDTLQTRNGCDSIVTLNLIVGIVSVTLIDTLLCNGESYTFFNRVITESGVYRDTLPTVYGCDSIIILSVNNASNLNDTLDITICNGENYLFNNQMLNQSGTYRDTLQTAGGCDSLVILNLSVLPPLLTNLDTSICKGQSIQIGNQTIDTIGNFTLVLQSTTGCDSTIQARVFAADAVFNSLEVTICDGDEYNFNGASLTQSGIYQDTLAAKDGCDSIVILILTVNKKPDVKIQSYRSFCEPNVVHLWATGDFDTIRWSNNATSDSIRVFELGTYSVTAIHSNNCTATDNFIYDAPTGLKMSARDLTCLEPYTALTIDQVTGGVLPYHFTINELPLQERPVFDSLPAGTYQITVEDAVGCTFETDFTILPADSIFLNLTADTVIQTGQSVKINLQTNATAPFTMQWTPDNTLNCNSCNSVTARPDSTVTYTAVLRDTNNCVATAKITIAVLRPKSEAVYAPNVFSPNGDGVNDFFTVFSGKEIKQVQMLRIFDRWGNLLYERQNLPANDPSVGWDGTFKGKTMPQGVYVYYAELQYLDDKTGQISGEMTLVR
jgi:gliding motility-associated-like protein